MLVHLFEQAERLWKELTNMFEKRIDQGMLCHYVVRKQGNLSERK